MAYISQEQKKEINKNLQKVLKKWGLKGRLGVEDQSSLRLVFTQVPKAWLDDEIESRVTAYEGMGGGDWNPRAIPEEWGINHYHIDGHAWEDAMKEILPILNGAGTDRPNWDKSDITTDYFNVGWWLTIQVGKYGAKRPVVYTD